MSGGIFNGFWTDGAISSADFDNRYTIVDHIRVWEDSQYALSKKI